MSDVSNVTQTNGNIDLAQTLTTSPIVNETLQTRNYPNCAIKTLDEIRKKYVNNVVIGHLNINSLRNKFDALTLIIKDRIDIMVLVETKLDESFTNQQFFIEGFKVPYRLDRNSYGGGVLIYVRKDIPSVRLNRHNFVENIEALFIEINLRKNKFLLVGTYHSTHPEYGTTDDKYFDVY